jgi:hypothetical protein
MNNILFGDDARPTTPFYLIALLLALCLTSTDALATRKTDIVYLKNGDKITGEFKELVQGELKLSTAEMGSVYIKWNGIARIESDKYIEMELLDGTRVFGQLPPEMNDSE